MRDKNIFSRARALPRMSWDPVNLYNLWQRSLGAATGTNQTTFQKTTLTLFQQRWRAKRLVRAYHGDYIPEQKFKKWYLPDLLPDIRTRKPLQHPSTLRIAGRAGEAKRLENETKAKDEALARAPVGSLMFQEVERRLDTLVFRSCFANSIYKARQMVLHGHVKLNGTTCRKAGQRLNPGDLFSVDPAAIPFLNWVAPAKKLAAEVQEIEEGEADAEATSESTEIAKVETPKPTFRLPDFAAPWIFIPAYLEPSFKTCSAVYVRHPTARKDYSEIPTPYDADGEVMRLAWEWYAKRRPRTRGRLQRETGPKGTRRPVPYWSQYQH